MKRSELKSIIREEIKNEFIRMVAEGVLQEVIVQGFKQAIKETNIANGANPGGRDSSGGRQVGALADLFSSAEQEPPPRMKAKNLGIKESERERMKRLVGSHDPSRSRFQHTNKTQAEVLAERKMAMAAVAPGMEQAAMQRANTQQSQQQLAFAPSTKAAPPAEPQRQVPTEYPGYD